MKVLLIDGDQYIFKACAAIEKEVKWDDQNHVLFSNAEEAWANASRMIRSLFDRFNTEEHALCFSAPPNFRLAIAPDYKGNRVTRKPLCYAELRERCNSAFNGVSMPGLEADDVMGILATKPQTSVGKRIIVSQDKDMKTIPATIWNGGELVVYSEQEADYWHLYQTLIGDVSDGYKGCPKIGPAKAEKLLDPGPMGFTAPARLGLWPVIVAAYEKAGLTEEHALQQARLARILRWSDWDSEKKEPVLWTPASS